jgi:hypothetical protein
MRKEARASVFAAGKQGREDTQIRIGEEPAFHLPSGGPGSADDGTDMFAAGHVAKMLGADSRQAGNFVLGENLLSGLNSDHSPPSFAVTTSPQFRSKWNSRHETASLPSNRPAVYLMPLFNITLNLQTFGMKSFSGKQRAKESNREAKRKIEN